VRHLDRGGQRYWQGNRSQLRAGGAKVAIADSNPDAANAAALQIREQGGQAPSNALTGQSLIVSHGWFME